MLNLLTTMSIMAVAVVITLVVAAATAIVARAVETLPTVLGTGLFGINGQSIGA